MHIIPPLSSEKQLEKTIGKILDACEKSGQNVRDFLRRHGDDYRIEFVDGKNGPGTGEILLIAEEKKHGSNHRNQI